MTLGLNLNPTTDTQNKGGKNAILDSYIFRANMAAFSAIIFNQTEDPLLQLLILFIQYSQELAEIRGLDLMMEKLIETKRTVGSQTRE